jgi:hypothetical protein
MRHGGSSQKHNLIGSGFTILADMRDELSIRVGSDEHGEKKIKDV